MSAGLHPHPGLLPPSRSQPGRTPIVGSYRIHASPPTLSGWLFFYIYYVLVCCVSTETPEPMRTWTVLRLWSSRTLLAQAQDSVDTPKQMGGWRGLLDSAGCGEPVEGSWGG